MYYGITGPDDSMTITRPDVHFLGDDGIAFTGEELVAVHQLSYAFGLDPTIDAQVTYQYGWNPFKAVAKAVTAPARAVVKAVSNPKAAVKSVVAAVKRPDKAIASYVKGKVADVKGGLQVAKTLAKSPIVKTVAAGAAIVFPPVGVPLAAGVATAAAIAAATESKIPAQAKAAAQVVLNTAQLAKSGDKGAQQALGAIDMAKQALKAEQARSVVQKANAKQTVAVKAGLVPVPTRPRPANARRLIVDVSNTGHITTQRA